MSSRTEWWCDCDYPGRCTANGVYNFGSLGFLHQDDLLFTKKGGINGSILYSVKGKNNEYNSEHYLIYLKGDYYQRGYAHGYLLADEIVELFEKYFYGAWFRNNIACGQGMGSAYTYLGNPEYSEYAPKVGYRGLYDYYKDNVNRYHFSANDLQELQGMLDGIRTRRGLNLNFGRQLDLDDLKMIQLEADWTQYTADYIFNYPTYVYCSADTFSGSFTGSGSPVSWRNLDYPFEPFIDTQCDLYHTIFLVENEAGFRYINILRPGSIGVASGFNQNGVFIGLDSTQETLSSRGNKNYLHELSSGRYVTLLFLRELLEKDNIDDLQSIIAGKGFTTAYVPTVTDNNDMYVMEMGTGGINLRGVFTPLYFPEHIGAFPQSADVLHNVNSYLTAYGHPFCTSSYDENDVDEMMLEEFYLLEDYTLKDFVNLKGYNSVDAEAAYNIDRGWLKNVNILVWKIDPGDGSSTQKTNTRTGYTKVTFDSGTLDFVAGFGTKTMDPINELYVKPLSYNFEELFAAIDVSSGDVNGDGLINVQDIQACVNHILGTQDWGEAGDVNNDGAVNVLDVQTIVNIILGG